MDLFEKITLKEVAKILNRKFIGSENHLIHGLSEIHNVQKGDLIYCDHPKYYKLALNSQADTIIINDEVDAPNCAAWITNITKTAHRIVTRTFLIRAQQYGRCVRLSKSSSIRAVPRRVTFN